MTISLSPIYNGSQQFTNAGVVLSGGKINTYAAGSSTPIVTYADNTGLVPNANPIILDSTGRYSQEIWLVDGTSYKFVLTDSANNVLQTLDNISAGNYSILALLSASGGSALVGYQRPGGTATTLQIAMNAALSGAVHMVVENGVWVVHAPDGTVVDTSASTTSGLQEAITYAVSNNFDLEVHGNGINGSSGANNYPITCTTSVSVPAVNLRSFRFGSVTVNFTNALGSNPGFLFDSFEAITWWFAGQVLYAGTGDVVKYAPTNVVKPDNAIASQNSLFYWNKIGATFVQPNNALVSFQPYTLSTNAYNANLFIFTELSAGAPGVTTNATAYSIQIVQGNGATTYNNFVGNKIVAPIIAYARTANIHLDSGLNTFGNRFEFGIQLNGTSTIGVNCLAGAGNSYQGYIQNVGGTTTTGIVLGANALQNTWDIPYNTATTPVSDSTIHRVNPGVYGPNNLAFSANLNNANQTAIATGTPTKINFSSVLYDLGTTFDVTTNHRWTPGRIGRAQVNAAMIWNTAGAGMVMEIMVYKNGAIVQENVACASGTVNQGISVSTIVDILASTDYIEIWVKQNSGGNLDIAGGKPNTWFTGYML